MLFPVELLDPRENPALDQALEIPVNARQAAAAESLLQPAPDIFSGKMRVMIDEKPDDRQPAGGEFEAACLQFVAIPLHAASSK